MGCKIKERRELLKMSQEELAEKSKVSRATISGLENNSKRNTSTKTLKRIADALETTVWRTFFLQMMSKDLDILSNWSSFHQLNTQVAEKRRKSP